MEEHCSLACFSWLAQPAILYTSRPHSQGWDQPPCKLDLPISIINQKKIPHRFAHRQSDEDFFFLLSFFFPAFCLVDKKLTSSHGMDDHCIDWGLCCGVELSVIEWWWALAGGWGGSSTLVSLSSHRLASWLILGRKKRRLIQTQRRLHLAKLRLGGFGSKWLESRSVR